MAGTTYLDAVHRVIGRPGVILVGEGAPHRVKPLLAQEKKKIARIVGDTPIYDFIVGNEEGETTLRKLASTVMKLPRNIPAEMVGDLDNRLSVLAGQVPGRPAQGPDAGWSQAAQHAAGDAPPLITLSGLVARPRRGSRLRLVRHFVCELPGLRALALTGLQVRSAAPHFGVLERRPVEHGPAGRVGGDRRHAVDVRCHGTGRRLVLGSGRVRSAPVSGAASSSRAAVAVSSGVGSLAGRPDVMIVCLRDGRTV